MKNIIIKNKLEVEDYFKEFPNLKKIVLEICRQANKEFGHNSELSLEMYFDPEIPYKYLTLLVRKEKYYSNFIKEIWKFRKKFHKQMSGIEGQILVTTDYEYPKSFKMGGNMKKLKISNEGSVLDFGQEFYPNLQGYCLKKGNTLIIPSVHSKNKGALGKFLDFAEKKFNIKFTNVLSQVLADKLKNRGYKFNVEHINGEGMVCYEKKRAAG
jgi:hypothetical protein